MDIIHLFVNSDGRLILKHPVLIFYRKIIFRAKLHKPIFQLQERTQATKAYVLGKDQNTAKEAKKSPSYESTNIKDIIRRDEERADYIVRYSIFLRVL